MTKREDIDRIDKNVDEIFDALDEQTDFNKVVLELINKLAECIIVLKDDVTALETDNDDQERRIVALETDLDTLSAAYNRRLTVLEQHVGALSQRQYPLPYNPIPYYPQQPVIWCDSTVYAVSSSGEITT